MKSVVFCIFFFVTSWALPNDAIEDDFKALFIDPAIDKLPSDVIGRITNGVEAAPHSIPYQAYLIVTGTSGGRWLCGGSLISQKHVLTAGHCVDDGVSAVIYLGAHNIQETESTRVTVQSRELIRHEDYSNVTYSDDIGVIVLSDPVEISEYVDVIALPSSDVTDNYEGVNARVSGWGRIAGDEPTSPVLLEVNSTVMANSQCKQIFNIVIDSQLCISGVGGVGSCRGDSGGPLVYDNVQIGIVSYGVRNCLPGYPSAFTRITSYLDWLEEKTGLKF